MPFPKAASHLHDGPAVGLLGNYSQKAAPPPLTRLHPVPGGTHIIHALRHVPSHPLLPKSSKFETKKPLGYSSNKSTHLMKFNNRPNGLFSPPILLFLLGQLFSSFKTRFRQGFSGTFLLCSSESPLGLSPLLLWIPLGTEMTCLSPSQWKFAEGGNCISPAPSRAGTQRH